MEKEVATRSKVYFASDMHFGSLYHEDALEVERKFVRWLCAIEEEAKAIILVGDIFDYWYEYKYVVPRGYTRVIGKLATLSDQGVEIVLFTGNHDIWMFDYLETEIGCTVYKAPQTLEFMGAKFYIAHGDEFVEDKGYRFLQSIFRSRFCQWLYAGIHPRWTVGFAHRWALASRKKGLELGHDDYRGEQGEYLVRYSKGYLAAHSEQDAPDFFIYGHRHIMLDLMLTHSSRVIILGDWIKHFSYAVWDGESMGLWTFEEAEDEES